MAKISKRKNIQLTERQHQCAELLLQGKTAREIAELMGLSRRTIEYYLCNIKSKLECKNKVELILAISNLLKPKSDKNA